MENLEDKAKTVYEAALARFTRTELSSVLGFGGKSASWFSVGSRKISLIEDIFSGVRTIKQLSVGSLSSGCSPVLNDKFYFYLSSDSKLRFLQHFAIWQHVTKAGNELVYVKVWRGHQMRRELWASFDTKGIPLADYWDFIKTLYRVPMQIYYTTAELSPFTCIKSNQSTLTQYYKFQK